MYMILRFPQNTKCRAGALKAGSLFWVQNDHERVVQPFGNGQLDALVVMDQRESNYSAAGFRMGKGLNAESLYSLYRRRGSM